MFDENDQEAARASEKFTRKFSGEVVKMEGTTSSSLGVGMRMVHIIESK
jgi:hypothetical protein